MSRASWATLIIAMLLIGGAITLFVTMFEKKTVTRSFGYSPEARLNDLLAADLPDSDSAGAASFGIRRRDG